RQDTACVFRHMCLLSDGVGLVLLIRGCELPLDRLRFRARVDAGEAVLPKQPLEQSAQIANASGAGLADNAQRKDSAAGAPELARAHGVTFGSRRKMSGSGPGSLPAAASTSSSS